MFDCYVSALCASASGASRMRHKMPRSTTMRLLFSTRPSTLNRSLHFHPLPVEVLSPSSALSHLLNARLSSAYCGLIKLVWEPSYLTQSHVIFLLQRCTSASFTFCSLSSPKQCVYFSVSPSFIFS